MRTKDWSRILAGLTVLAPLPYTAHAETYLSETQAAAALFPGIKLQADWIDLSKEQIRAIEKTSGERVRVPRLRVLRGSDGEMLFIDQVLGKHEFITYAVAVSTAGTIQGVEIMDYHETYGYQVRERSWLSQFAGKGVADRLKVEKDIRNISGATLSSVHVTNGVRRILRTYEAINAKT